MSGVSPEIAAALLHFDLITEEEAEVAVAEYQEEWRRAYETAFWWRDVAKIAWQNETSFWHRFWQVGTPPFGWTMAWIKEHRGW